MIKIKYRLIFIIYILILYTMANKKNLKKISSKRKTEKMNEKSSISALPQTDLAMAETMAMIAAWKLVGAEAVNRAAANETVEFRGDKVHYDKKVKESLLENYKNYTQAGKKKRKSKRRRTKRRR